MFSWAEICVAKLGKKNSSLFFYEKANRKPNDRGGRKAESFPVWCLREDLEVWSTLAHDLEAKGPQSKTAQEWGPETTAPEAVGLWQLRLPRQAMDISEMRFPLWA